MTAMSEKELVAHFSQRTVADLQGYAYYQLEDARIAKLKRKGDLVAAIVEQILLNRVKQS